MAEPSPAEADPDGTWHCFEKAADTLPLEQEDVWLLRRVGALDWSAIETAIFGIFFERGLDPGKRSQLGAHFTDPGSIMRLVNPVVLDPLRDEWAARKAEIEALMAKSAGGKSASARTKATYEAHRALQGFLHRLVRFRVLDPACGSGDFLLLSLLVLEDLEHQVILEAESWACRRPSRKSATRTSSASRSTLTPSSWPGSPFGLARFSGRSPMASPCPRTRSSSRSTQCSAGMRS